MWLRFYYLVALCIFWGATLDFSKNQSWREVLKVKWHSANSWRLRAAIFVFVCRGVTRASCEEQEELCVCRNIAAPPLCYVTVLLSLPTSERHLSLTKMDFRARTFNKHRRSFIYIRSTQAGLLLFGKCLHTLIPLNSTGIFV